MTIGIKLATLGLRDIGLVFDCNCCNDRYSVSTNRSDRIDCKRRFVLDSLVTGSEGSDGIEVEEEEDKEEDELILLFAWSVSFIA